MSERADPGFAVRAAAIAALEQNTELRAITGDENRVWEYVDANAPLPYLQVTSDDSSDWSFSQAPGSEEFFTVHAWSDAKGAEEAEQMLQIAKEVLHDAHLDLTQDGHQLVNLRFVSKTVMRDIDGETYHGTARYRAPTEEN